MSASTMDAPKACAATMAGIACCSVYGLYSGWPFWVKKIGSMPNSTPTQKAATVMPT